MNIQLDANNSSQPSRRVAARGAVWVFAGNMGRQILSIAVFAVLARKLGPDAFGLVALAMIWIAFAEIFINQGMGMAIVQRKEVDPEHLDTAFWMAVFCGSSLFLSTLVAAPMLTSMASAPEADPVLKWLGLSFLVTASSGVQNAILTRELRFRELTVRNLAGLLAGSMAGLGLAFTGFGVWALVGQTLTSAIVGAVVLWFASSWRPRFRFSGRHLAELWGFSSSVLVTNIVAFLSTRADQLLIGRLLGTQSLGLFSTARRLPVLLGDALTTPVSSVAMPVLARMGADAAAFQRAILEGVRLVSSIAFPAFVILACLSSEVVEIVFGSGWSGAAEVMRAFAICEVFRAAVSFSYPAIMAAGRPKVLLGIQLVHAFGTVIVALVGIRWGINGVAIGILINAFFVASVQTVAVCRVCNLSIFQYLRTLVPPAVAVSALALSVEVAMDAMSGIPMILRMTIAGIAGGAVYLAMLALLGRSHLQTVFDMVVAVVSRAKPRPVGGVVES